MFRKDLRRSVIFGRHDLIQDAPISRIDLLVCRNTLMYFNAETQARILRPLPLRAAPTAACCSSARPRCCSPTPTCSRRSTCKQPDLPQGRRRDCVAGARRSSAEAQAAPDGRAARRGRICARGRSTPRRWPRSSSTPTGRWPWPTSGPRRCSGCRAARPRPAVPGPRAVLPAGRAALAASSRLVTERRAVARRATSSGRPRRRDRVPRHPGRPAARTGRRLARRCSIIFTRHDAAPAAAGRAGARQPASWRRPTRSCSRPTRSWRRPTRSCSPRSRSWRRPTRSSSRPTRSSRR